MINPLGSPLCPRALTLVLLLLASGACASAPERPFDELRGPRGATVLLVTNRGWSDVEVYQADGSTPVRLGMVPALRSGALVIRVGPVQLLLRPSASSETFRPEPVWVTPGQVAELIVQPMLQASELNLRWRPRL
jgi:hypothetical protein